MKAVAVSILIFLVAVQSFSQWAVLLNFRMNREYISTTLCINKQKPQTRCGGKCQLMKAMEKESSAPSSPASSATVKFTEVQFPLEEISAVAGIMPDCLPAPLPYYLLRRYAAPAPAIFHPPA
jgi:hypothetical protein